MMKKERTFKAKKIFMIRFCLNNTNGMAADVKSKYLSPSSALLCMHTPIKNTTGIIEK
jgi:hypothetical protein